MTGRELHWLIGDRTIAIRIEESSGHGVLRIDDRAVPFAVRDRDASGGWIEVGGKNRRFYVHRNANEWTVWLDGRTWRLKRLEESNSLDASTTTNGPGEVRALMPGKILRIDVAVGDSVVERQPILIMESMKMETALAAPRAGVVTAVSCSVGDVVNMDQVLITIG
jgi:3-methylcrotonyl-CoA carboxylase alpha subunit